MRKREKQERKKRQRIEWGKCTKGRRDMEVVLEDKLKTEEMGMTEQ